MANQRFVVIEAKNGSAAEMNRVIQVLGTKKQGKDWGIRRINSPSGVEVLTKFQGEIAGYLVTFIFTNDHRALFPHQEKVFSQERPGSENQPIVDPERTLFIRLGQKNGDHSEYFESPVYLDTFFFEPKILNRHFSKIVTAYLREVGRVPAWTND